MTWVKFNNPRRIKMALTPEQKGQLVSMIKDGKANDVIQEHFKSSYNITIPGWQFNYERGKLNKLATVSDGKKKRGYKRKGVAPEENILKEIIGMLGEINSGYNKMFKFLRLELIKSRAQVHDMLKGAGIPADET